MVTCMALYVSYFDGLDSGSATVAVAIAFIVMYDASHVRLEVGKHASRINKFISYSNNRRADVDLESHGENRDEGKNARDTTPLVDVQTRGKYASSAVNVYSVTEGLEEAVGTLRGRGAAAQAQRPCGSRELVQVAQRHMCFPGCGQSAHDGGS